MGKPFPKISHLHTSVLFPHMPFQGPPVCTHEVHTVLTNYIDNFVHGLKVVAVFFSTFGPVIL